MKKPDTEVACLPGKEVKGPMIDGPDHSIVLEEQPAGRVVYSVIVPKLAI